MKKNAKKQKKKISASRSKRNDEKKIQIKRYEAETTLNNELFPYFVFISYVWTKLAGWLADWLIFCIGFAS